MKYIILAAVAAILLLGGYLLSCIGSWVISRFTKDEHNAC